MPEAPGKESISRVPYKTGLRVYSLQERVASSAVLKALWLL